MSDWQQRVRDERDQLLDKLRKLDAFTKGDQFAKLDDLDRDLLTQQLRAMDAYYSILVRRTIRFK